MSHSSTYTSRYLMKTGNLMTLKEDTTVAQCNLLGFYRGTAVVEFQAQSTTSTVPESPNPMDNTNVNKLLEEDNNGTVKESILCGKRIILNTKRIPGQVIIINSKNVEIPLTKCTVLKPFTIGQDMLRRALESPHPSKETKLKDNAYHTSNIVSDKVNSLSRTASHDKKFTADRSLKDKAVITCSDIQEFEVNFYKETSDTDSPLSHRINNRKTENVDGITQTSSIVYQTDDVLQKRRNSFTEAEKRPLKVYGRRKTTAHSVSVDEEKPKQNLAKNKCDSVQISGKRITKDVDGQKCAESENLMDNIKMGKIKHFKDKNGLESLHISNEIMPDENVKCSKTLEASASNIRTNPRTKRIQISKKRLFIRREIERCLMQRRTKKQRDQTVNAKSRSISCQTSFEKNTNSTQTEDVKLVNNMKICRIEISTQTDAGNEIGSAICQPTMKDENSNIANAFSDEIALAEFFSEGELYLSDTGANTNFGQGPVITPCKVYNTTLDVPGMMRNVITSVNSPVYEYGSGYHGGNAFNHNMQEKILFFNCLKHCTEVRTMGSLGIHLAVSQDDVAEVRRQCLALKVRKVSLDTVNDNDMTPLHLAIVSDCQPEIVYILLMYGADINITDRDGNNPLHLAVMSGAGSILKMLLSVADRRNFKVDLFNYEGFTPLMLATLENSIAMVHMLLDSKADANLRDQKSGRTPLFHAVENNNTGMVKLLLKYKANTKIRNFFGTSTHEAIFELDSINQEIKSIVIGKDVYQNRGRATEKRRATSRKQKSDVSATKKPKLRIVKLLKKVT